MASAWETPTATGLLPEERQSSGFGFAANEEISPFGSHISLAVTEKDMVSVFSSAKGYA